MAFLFNFTPFLFETNLLIEITSTISERIEKAVSLVWFTKLQIVNRGWRCLIPVFALVEHKSCFLF